jgi:hypothetical protein
LKNNFLNILAAGLVAALFHVASMNAWIFIIIVQIVTHILEGTDDKK